MTTFKKGAILVAALLCAFGAAIAEPPITVYVHYYEKNVCVEAEGAKLDAEWDPDRYVALTRHKKLPVGTEVQIEYADDKGYVREVKVKIVGLCPKSLRTCWIILSYAAAGKIKIRKAEDLPRRVAAKKVTSGLENLP